MARMFSALTGALRCLRKSLAHESGVNAPGTAAAEEVEHACGCRRDDRRVEPALVLVEDEPLGDGSVEHGLEGLGGLDVPGLVAHREVQGELSSHGSVLRRRVWSGEVDGEALVVVRRPRLGGACLAGDVVDPPPVEVSLLGVVPERVADRVPAVGGIEPLGVPVVEDGVGAEGSSPRSTSTGEPGGRGQLGGEGVLLGLLRLRLALDHVKDLLAEGVHPARCESEEVLGEVLAPELRPHLGEGSRCDVTGPLVDLADGVGGQLLGHRRRGP